MTGPGVEISGCGAVASTGVGVAKLTRALLAGEGAIRDLSAKSGVRFTKGAPVAGFDPHQHFDPRTLGGLDRFTQFAAVAAREAVAEAGLPEAGTLPERMAVVIGTANGGIDILDEGFARILREGRKPRPMTVPMTMAGAPATRIAREINAQGPVFGVSSACASSAHAILLGMMLIRTGTVDVAVVGGTDSCFSGGYLQAWDGLRLVSPDTCRPFSAKRRGLIIGEGAAILVLEAPGRARARGAAIRGRLIGAGMASEAGDLIAPDAQGMARAMRAALLDGGIGPARVDYINAQGTGTAANDRLEAHAIREVFGDATERISVSSTKSMLGHAMGAAGAIEAIASLAAIEAETIPPTLNYLGPDPDCAIDPTPNVPRARSIDVALSNSFAFGGTDVCLAFARVDA